MRYVGLVILSLMGVAPVQAQSLKIPSTVFLIAAGADTTTTTLGVASGHYQDTNPLIRGPVTAVAVGAGTAALTLWSAHRLKANGHPKWAAGMLWVSAGLRGFYAGHNLMVLSHRNE